MRTERHLLEMAAKAGRVDVDFTKPKGEYFALRGSTRFWNPGLSSTQAFDLADALRLMVDISDKRVRVTCPKDVRVVDLSYDEHPRMAINRLAILLIAAEIGEAMG